MRFSTCISTGLLLLALSVAGGTAFAATKLVTNCEKNAAPLNGGYCVTKTQGSTNQDVLYYFHGRGLNESAWLDDTYYTAQLRQQWDETREQAPIVVSISFGKDWILAQKNQSPYSGLFEVFIQGLLPKIETSLGGVKGRRLLLGESMGGFNSIQMALKTTLFEKVAILCAPIAEISPFSPTAEVEAYIRRTNADRSLVLELLEMGKAFFPTTRDWQTASPLALAREYKKASAPEFYLAAGYYDGYGLYSGNAKFGEILRRSGATINWRPQWGGHCAIDIESLARFLTH